MLAAQARGLELAIGSFLLRVSTFLLVHFLVIIALVIGPFLDIVIRPVLTIIIDILALVLFVLFAFGLVRTAALLLSLLSSLLLSLGQRRPIHEQS